MKSEAGTFTPNSSSVTVLLNDNTLNVKALFLQIGKNTAVGEGSTGFTDGVTNRSKSILINSASRSSRRSTTHCITHYDYISSTVQAVIAGRAVSGSFSTPGQFTLPFDIYSAIPIDYIVIGD